MGFHVQSTEIVPDEASAFLRAFRTYNFWRLCPYGCWTEHDGSGVIFDRKYRPICRVRRGGAVEIVPPDEFISYWRQRFFHSGFWPAPDGRAREILAQIIAKYGLVAELRQRSDMLRSGYDLPCWNGQRAA